MSDTSETGARHRLILELGRGGMGTVYLAVSEGPSGFSKLKVVKRLRDDLALDPAFLAMFMDEARLAARLIHPNVVQTNEVGFDGAHYFIEMEYLDGQALASVQRRAESIGGIPQTTAVWICEQTLAGLHFAHELADHDGSPLHVVHRDVSPQNVFLTYEGNVKVLDFGIAKAADSSQDTRTGVVKGKVTYMSPEQSLGRRLDRRNDVFAVGVILWELLARRRMWEGLGDGEIFKRLDAGAIPRASELSHVPPRLAAICDRALAPDVRDRFETAKEFQDALEAFLDQEATRVGPRQVAKLVVELFENRRRAVQNEIAEQLRLTEQTRRMVDVPVLGYSRAYALTPKGVDPSAPRGPDETRAPATAPHRMARADPEATRSEGRRRPEPIESPRAASPVDARPIADDADAEPKTSETNLTRTSTRPLVAAARTRRSRLALAAIATLSAVGALAFVGARHAAPPVAAPPSTATGARAPCATRADCVAIDPSGRSICAGDGRCAPSPGCVSSSECGARLGQPALCRNDGECVAFASDECTVSAGPGDTANDETLWLGVLLPQGPDADEFRTIRNCIDLGRRDFAEDTGGLPSTRAGRAPRPIGLVFCGHADVERSARHLASELRVPAIIGFGMASDVIDLAPPLFFPNHVLALETFNANALITSVPQLGSDPRLVWRTMWSGATIGPPLAAVVGDVLEPRIRRARAARDPVRVALVRRSNPASLSAADAFVSSLRVNGVKAAENADNFRQFVVRGDDERARVDELVAFQPHVVVFLGPSFYASFADALETKWSEPQSRPIYLQSGTLVAPAYKFIGRSHDRMSRTFGLDFPANTDTNLKFVLRYNEFFTPPLTTATAPGVAYDAFYVLAYAAATVQGEPITGPSLARGIERLIPPGEPIDVGPSDVFRAIKALRAGKNVDLNGAGSRLDFDTSTGETSADYVVYCAKAGADGAATDALESGLRYDPASRHVRGEARCP